MTQKGLTEHEDGLVSTGRLLTQTIMGRKHSPFRRSGRTAPRHSPQRDHPILGI